MSIETSKFAICLAKIQNLTLWLGYQVWLSATIVHKSPLYFVMEGVQIFVTLNFPQHHYLWIQLVSNCCSNHQVRFQNLLCPINSSVHIKITEKELLLEWKFLCYMHRQILTPARVQTLVYKSTTTSSLYSPSNIGASSTCNNLLMLYVCLNWNSREIIPQASVIMCKCPLC